MDAPCQSKPLTGRRFSSILPSLERIPGECPDTASENSNKETGNVSIAPNPLTATDHGPHSFYKSSNLI